MRVAAIYDIHGNLPALEAVLQDIRQAEVDQVVVGGDVFPGPMPRETLTYLLGLNVGMPFGEPGAYWLLLRPGVQLRHTPYDLTKAAERIRGTSYPQAQDFAARNILQLPSEGEMLEAFTRVN